MEDNVHNSADADAGGMAFELWLKLIGRDQVTGWRWAKAGIVTTSNVLGRSFITADEIKRFWTRVKAGEFAIEPKGAAAKAKKLRQV